jgi:hypothetical protein
MRPLVAVLTCWLVLLRAEPVALHACPMHDAGHGAGMHAAAAAAPIAAGDDVHGAHAAGAHAATAHGHHADAPPPAPDEAADGCLCLGCCGGIPAVATVATPPLAWLASILDVAPVLSSPGARVGAAPRDDVALPYPNAPPAPLAA